MSGRYEAMQDDVDGASSSGAGNDVGKMREERIARQQALMQQRRKEQLVRPGAMSAGPGGRKRPGTAGTGGFVPRPPEGSLKGPSSARPSGMGGAARPKSAASVLKSQTDGRIGSSRGVRHEPTGLAGSTGGYRTASGVTNSTNLPSSNSASRASETERMLAAENIRGDVDYSAKRSSSSDVLDEDLAAEVLSEGEKTGRPGHVEPANVASASSGKSRSSVDSDNDDRSTSDTSEPMRDCTSPMSSVGSNEASGSSDVPVASAQVGSPTANQTTQRVDTGPVSEFIHRALSTELKVKCRFSRRENTYFLHMEQPQDETTFLLAAKKRLNARSQDYVISLDGTNFSKSCESYLGKLQGNMGGTEFTLYDTGANPVKSRALPDHSNVREELVSVVYSKNLVGLGGPRKMSVILPHLNPLNSRIKVLPTCENETLLNMYKTNNLRKSIVVLENKLPTWSEENESFVLNFSGRVSKASVKNFQIVHPNDKDYIVMQFGRVADDSFTLDFCYPLCPLQAFGIALSSCSKNWAQ